MLRTVRATHRGTRLKQAARVVQVRCAGLLSWRARCPRWQEAWTRRVWSPSGEPGPPWCRRELVAIARRVTWSHHRSHCSGDWGGCSVVSRCSPHSGQRPSCLVSRRSVYVSSGGLTLRRRVAQYPAREGVSGGGPPLAIGGRKMGGQESLGREGPLVPSPNPHR